MNAPTRLHIDPLLGEVFELLHRMTVCREDTPATRMAGEALKKLRRYEDAVRTSTNNEKVN